MEKTKEYDDIRFKPETITEALNLLIKSIGSESEKETFKYLLVDSGEEVWRHDSFEEFVSDLRRPYQTYTYAMEFKSFKLWVAQHEDYCEVKVDAEERKFIESAFEVFERQAPTSHIEHPLIPKKQQTVFIGHGNSQQWRDLKDHLHEQHGYIVQAYEIGARAGHTIRDILETMMKESSFAILVLTGEDEDIEGKLHPRLNVVHELGLFQGVLGFSKAIALLEDGVEEFSNIHGIQQIRYREGNIRETFGDILATLRREFLEDVAKP